jgi:hypothetical protein
MNRRWKRSNLGWHTPPTRCRGRNGGRGRAAERRTSGRRGINLGEIAAAYPRMVEARRRGNTGGGAVQVLGSPLAQCWRRLRRPGSPGRGGTSLSQREKSSTRRTTTSFSRSIRLFFFWDLRCTWNVSTSQILRGIRFVSYRRIQTIAFFSFLYFF